MTSAPALVFIPFMLASSVKTLYKAVYRLFTQESNGLDPPTADPGGAAHHADDRSVAAAAPRGGGGADAVRPREGGARAVPDGTRRLPLPRSRRSPAERSRAPVLDEPPGDELRPDRARGGRLPPAARRRVSERPGGARQRSGSPGDPRPPRRGRADRAGVGRPARCDAIPAAARVAPGTRHSAREARPALGARPPEMAAAPMPGTETCRWCRDWTG